jgi:hypothetical protein
MIRKLQVTVTRWWCWYAVKTTFECRVLSESSDVLFFFASKHRVENEDTYLFCMLRKSTVVATQWWCLYEKTMVFACKVQIESGGGPFFRASRTNTIAFATRMRVSHHALKATNYGHTNLLLFT